MSEARYYRCFYKAVLTTRSGDPMLAARLIEPCGPIGALACDEIDDLVEAFEPGDVVRAVGTPTEYRGKPSLRIEAINCVRAAPAAAIVPRGQGDVDELRGYAQHYLSEITDNHFRRLITTAW